MAFLKHLLASAVLALLVTLSGCSEMPAGLDAKIYISFDPFGIGFSLKNPPQITLSGPDGFTLPAPAPQPSTNLAP